MHKVAKILKFYTDTCGPCKAQSKIIEESKHKSLVENINARAPEASDLLINYRVSGVPTLVKLDEKGLVLGKHTGLLSLEAFDKFVESV